MAEIRKQLSVKQFETLVRVYDDLDRAEAQARSAREKAALVTDLVLDAVAMPEGSYPSLDRDTRELVGTIPDPSPAPLELPGPQEGFK